MRTTCSWFSSIKFLRSSDQVTALLSVDLPALIHITSPSQHLYNYNYVCISIYHLSQIVGGKFHQIKNYIHLARLSTPSTIPGPYSVLDTCISMTEHNSCYPPGPPSPDGMCCQVPLSPPPAYPLSLSTSLHLHCQTLVRSPVLSHPGHCIWGTAWPLASTQLLSPCNQGILYTAWE